MYCPDKLKLNKFKMVSIPSNKEYFKRIGQVSLPSSQFSGEGVSVPMNMRKTDMLAKAQVLVERDIQAYKDNKEGND